MLALSRSGPCIKVIPAQAGIQEKLPISLDSGLRRNDGENWLKISDNQIIFWFMGVTSICTLPNDSRFQN